MAGAGASPLLRLKDLLELDCDSCSAAGFRCYPRRLLVGESSPSLRRRRPPSKLSHLSRSLSRRLSRRGGGFWRRRDEVDEHAAASAGCGGSSVSEELETSSSQSSDNSSERTSRRSRSESESYSDLSSATEDSVHHPPSQAAAAAGDEHEVAMKRVSKEGSSSVSEAEADDKEQLSPVAVMDFPFDVDDEDELRDAAVACSPSFSLSRLQMPGFYSVPVFCPDRIRTSQRPCQMLTTVGHDRAGDPAGPTSPVTVGKGRKTHKIGRFGSRDDLPPLDLEARLATMSDADGPAAADPAQQQMIQCRTEDAATPTPTCAGNSVHDVPDEDGLISLLMGTVSSAGLDDDVSERLLLLDFFLEMKRRRSEAHAEAVLPLPGPAAGGVLRRKADWVVDDGEADVAAAARGWLEGSTGTERWGLADVLISGGAAIVAEMERGRRWMQVGEEEREIGAVVAAMLADQLVGEVVRCLFV